MGNCFRDMSEEQAKVFVENLGMMERYIRKNNLPIEDSKVSELMYNCLARSILNHDSEKGSLITYFEANAKYVKRNIEKYLDAKKRSHLMSDYELDEHTRGDLESLSVQMFDRDKEAVELILEMLNPRQRKIMSLIIAGYTQRQIASKLGVGVTTVKREISRVKEKVKSRMKEVI